MLRTIKKDREKITAAVKADAGSCATKVSSDQSNIMVRMEMMMVTWMDQKKHQSLNVTFDNIKNKAMECYSYPREKETSPVPNFVASMDWFYKFKVLYGFHSVKRSREAKSANEDAAVSYPDRPAIIEEGVVQPPSGVPYGWNGPAVEEDIWTHIHHEGEVCPSLQSVHWLFHPPAGG